MGLLIVYLGTLLINSQTDFTVTLTLGNIVLGLSISPIIGLVSGLAPAASASGLDPVEAMNSTF